MTAACFSWKRIKLMCRRYSSLWERCAHGLCAVRWANPCPAAVWSEVLCEVL